MSDIARTLNFFHDIELMEIPAAQRLARGDRGRAPVTEHTVDKPGTLPWHGPRPGLTEATATYYLVWLGCADMRRIVEHMLTSIDPENPVDREEMARLYETAAMGTIILDWQGRPLEKSLAPAPFVFGVPELAKGNPLTGVLTTIEETVDCLMPELFGDMIEAETGRSMRDRKADKISFDDDASEDEDEECGGRRSRRAVVVHREPAEMEQLLALSRSFASRLGIEDVEPAFRITSREVWFRKGAPVPHPDFSDAVTHSFHADELGVLVGIAANTEDLQGFSPVLKRYLGAELPIEERVNLLADGRAMAEAVRLDRIPSGRWPSSPEHPLSLAQQAAVGAALHSDDLLAINGPPGTGKTTLLRDVIAQEVVARADRLAKLANPSDAFEQLRMTEGAVWVARPEIAEGTGIVVASNNNAAVENISRELPGRHTVDARAFADADYLGEVAHDVARSFGDKDAECWGLLALPFGNAENIRRSFQGLDGKKAGSDGKTEPHGLYDRLSAMGPASINSWFTARNAYLSARTALQQAMKQHILVQKDLDQLREIEDALSGMTDPQRVPDLPDQGACDPAVAEGKEGPAAEDSDADHAAGAARVRARLRRRKVGWRYPDEKLFAQPPATWHLQSVWVDREIEELRSRLFLAALNLHEMLLRVNAVRLRSFIWTARKIVRGEAEASSKMKVAVWNTLFLISPVISTSLASVRRMPFRQGWIGHVLIDEAGQATPQSVAPLLYRARRATVVGDPLQVEPVVKMPRPVIERIRAGHDAELRFSPCVGSAQSVADSVMREGAWVSLGADERVWTGMPLRAHRRCAEPMFSVANRIAYDGQMVQAAHGADMVEGVGPSCWMDVRGTSAADKVVPEELEMLRRSLERIRRNWPRRGDQDASICVISPFVSVEQAAAQVARTVFGKGSWQICPTGTVHRFQGREKDIVFLLLGSAPGARGEFSRNWASARPNLLNVALTRAKARVYVIGNYDDWSRCAYFSELCQEFWQRGAVKPMTFGAPAGA